MITGASELFDSIHRHTRRVWEQGNGPSDHPPPAWDPGRVSITSGGFVGNGLKVLPRLLREVRDAVGPGDSVEVTDASTAHLSFVVVSPPDYPDMGSLPDLSDLADLFSPFGKDWSVTLTGLRWLAFPDALVLVGMADDESIRRRNGFAMALQGSRYRDRLMAFHRGRVFPPVLWHITMARTRGFLLPSSLRVFYREQEGRRFGTCGVPVKLLAARDRWDVTCDLTR